ncbi:MAG TPA: aldose 1-epimerase [Acidobacteriaceae bacterium]|nr:aldose 1-epimerase [Acidobacteriaceae bacterium]
MAFILAYRQHVQGNFHKLKERMAVERPQVADPRPGGQEPVVLTRTRLMEDAVPEFLSVTMLPGRGMNVLQIRAYVPGKGERDLMDSPSLAAASAQMTGKKADVDGQASLAMGGAFSVPWADRVWTANPETGHAAVTWQGRTVALPTGETIPAQGGLILAMPSSGSNTSTLPDGGQAEASFRGSGKGWFSKTDVQVTALLSSHTLDLTVTAHNTGDAAEPIGIGWMPRFAVRTAARRQIRMRIPGESRVERGERNGAPTGKLLPVSGTAFDFTARDGGKLSDRDMDECFADLEQDVLENGPVAELDDAADGYRLRLTSLSPEIKAIRVVAPANANFVMIGPQFNYPDPFGHEWTKSGGNGMVTLAPGQSVQWKVRLEILPLNGNDGRP